MSRVVGLGVDVVELVRFARILARHGEAFERRVFLAAEIRPHRAIAARAAHLAGLFAAKEAALKALGTGWARGLVFRHVEITRDEHGAPALNLHGAAARRARELGVERLHVSITHDGPVAAAVVVLEGSPPEESA